MNRDMESCMENEIDPCLHTGVYANQLMMFTGIVNMVSAYIENSGVTSCF